MPDAPAIDLLRRMAVIGFVIFAVIIFVYAIVTTPFVPALPVKEPDLPETSWEGALIFTADGTGSPVIAGTRVLVQFSGDGTVTGSSGCNQFSGKFSSGGGKLAISGMGITKMHCTSPSGVMQQEDRFLYALFRSAAFNISGNMLTLSDATGMPLLTFSRVP